MSVAASLCMTCWFGAFQQRTTSGRAAFLRAAVRLMASALWRMVSLECGVREYPFSHRVFLLAVFNKRRPSRHPLSYLAFSKAYLIPAISAHSASGLFWPLSVIKMVLLRFLTFSVLEAQR